MKRARVVHASFTFLWALLGVFLLILVFAGGALYKITAQESLVSLSPTMPVLHFTFDSLSNGAFDDAVNENRKGRVVGNTNTGEGVISQAARFDGADDIVVFPNLELTPQFTVSSWVKLNSVKSAPAINTIMIKGEESGTRHPYLFYIDSNRKAVFVLRQDTHLEAVVTSNTTLSLGTWYFISITYESGSLNLYINGVLDKEITTPPYTRFFDYNNPVYIGGVNNTIVNQTQSEFNGSIDDLKIYSSALGSSDILSQYIAARLVPLQRQYNFETIENSKTPDESTNDLDGAVVGATIAKGIDLNAMRFDGDDYVDARAQGPLSAGKLSISAWVRPTDFAGEPYRTIFSSAASANNAGAYGLRVVGDASADNRGRLEFFYGPTNGGNYLTFRSNAVLPTGDWSFVGVTFDGATVRLYVNGKDDIAHQTSQPFIPREGASVGAMNMSGQGMINRWKGDIDAVKIHSLARPGGEFESEYRAVNLILHHTFNTVRSGTVSDDSSAHNLDGQLFNARRDSNGVDDDALAFDGNNDYMEIPNSDRLDFASGSFTIGLWLKASNTNGTRTLLEKRGLGSSDASRYYRLAVDDGMVEFTARCNQTASLTSEGSLTAGRWYHITVVRDAARDKLELYLNGERNVSESDSMCDEFSNAARLLVGGSAGGDDYFAGTIDDLRIYASALSGNAVEDLFEEYEDDIPRTVVRNNTTSTNATAPPSTSCTPQWSCTWSECVANQQSLTCTDTKNCGTTAGKPAETTRSCVSLPESSGTTIGRDNLDSSSASSTGSYKVVLFIVILLALVGIAAVAIVLVIKHRSENRQPSVYQRPMVTR